MKYFAKFHPDNFYHIFNHAVGKDNLFRNHDNYTYFLSRYAHHISPIAKTFCYCLMPNHFHILIQVRDENHIRNLANNYKSDFDFHRFIMQKFSNFLNGYAKAFNKQNRRMGALFVDYTKRSQIKDETHLCNIINYIHQNPVHHGFCQTANEWTYSSYNSFLIAKGSRLERDEVFNWFGGLEKFVDFHREVGSFNLDLPDL